MKYFTHLNRHNEPSNKLQIAALKVLKAASNLLIEDKDAFLTDLHNQIIKLNNEHFRCNALSFSVMTHPKQIVVFLGGTFTVGFYLYPVRLYPVRGPQL